VLGLSFDEPTRRLHELEALRRSPDPNGGWRRDPQWVMRLNHYPTTTQRGCRRDPQWVMRLNHYPKGGWRRDPQWVMRLTKRREFDRATVAVIAQGTAAYVVSSDRLPDFPGLPLALTGHAARTVVPVGFPGVVRLAPEAQVDSGVLRLWT